MSKVFVEYAIKPEYREPFLIYMQQWQHREGRLELLEGTDQKGLYVEIWNGVSYEEYTHLKQVRLQGKQGDLQPDWEAWVEGGLRKLHMWHFAAVSSSKKGL
ncbi:hypothetical protein BC351_18015 [Paenibacillus ferrarius]|uniref:NIPSNAP domain-containing protein n=1 Tax=Paenibacillus ferrarius TaxID=1469647 RepID=A0A1V4HQ65_9BACL|nr:hypothetical protein [Paenibacillus ferrarius]OPH60392.1 hypothetical protein BC351_18015 [Paenibacillus ferrarius]